MRVTLKSKVDPYILKIIFLNQNILTYLKAELVQGRIIEERDGDIAV